MRGPPQIHCYRITMYLYAWAATNNTKLSTKNQNNYLKNTRFSTCSGSSSNPNDDSCYTKLSNKKQHNKNYYVGSNSDIDYLID